MINVTPDKLHETLLNIAKEFSRICHNYGIPYYMLGGTMLGAIRHKGFIPWDDDMDFGVPRKYFEMCKEKLARDLPSCLEVLSIENCDGVLTDLIKVSDRRTIIREVYKEGFKDDIGINIDIFPLDFTDESHFGRLKNKLINILCRIQYYRFLSVKQRPFVNKIVAYCIKVLLYPLNRLSIINFIRKHLLSTKGNLIANYYGAWGNREIMPASILIGGGITCCDPMIYDFEDTKFYGVHNADAYLKSLYGDYMILPPKDKRHLHIENVFFK